MAQPIGTWDAEMFDAFRKAKGPRRRMLLGQLLVQNAPLVKVLLDQFIQPSGKSKHGPNLLKGGTEGFTDIPWEDGYQMASIAFVKACEGYDPSKGKFPWYLKLKMRHELQTLVASGQRTVRVPRGSEQHIVPVDLVGEQEALDRMGGSVEDGVAALEGITADDVRRWEETGEWPESLEDALPKPAPPPEEPLRPAIDVFLEQHVVFRSNARVARMPLLERWKRVAMRAREFPRLELLQAVLVERDVRVTSVNVPWSSTPVRGFAGVQLRSAA